MAKFRGLNITMSPLRATASMARDMMDEENDHLVEMCAITDQLCAAPAGDAHIKAKANMQDIAARTAQADMMFVEPDEQIDHGF